MRRNKLRNIKSLILNNHTREGDCWIYSGYKDKNGYANIKYKGATHRLTRLSYLIFKGRFDSSKIVCHSCDVPSCVNPDHLWLGTHKDNTHDMIYKGRKGVKPKNTSGCVEEGCTSKYHAKGLCKKHYTRHYRRWKNDDIIRSNCITYT